MRPKRSRFGSAGDDWGNDPIVTGFNEAEALTLRIRDEASGNQMLYAYASMRPKRSRFGSAAFFMCKEHITPWLQ